MNLDSIEISDLFSFCERMEKRLSIDGQRVLILGNWAYRNMGDELILLGTVRLLQDAGKKVLISAYDPQWLKKFFSQFSGMEEVSYLHEFPKGVRSGFCYFWSGYWKQLYEYRSVDTVIIGGGEILTEESKDAYWYRNLGLLPLLGKLGKQVGVYLMGGIQIPKKWKNLTLFRWLLKRTRAIYARDKESVQALKDFGFANANFFMDTSWYAYPRDQVQKTEDSKIVLVNLNKNGEQFFDALVQECRTLLATGFEIKYVPVSKGSNEVYDDVIYKSKLEKAL